MSVGQWLVNLILPSRRAKPEPAPPALQRQPRDWAARRWESADTDRLNKAHWSHAQEVSLNSDLAGDLPTLRARVALETANNPWVEGVINTHAADVVGPMGPGLQVQSDSPRYNDALEQAWVDWFADPTTRGDVDGAAMLRLWVRDQWTAGECLAQLATRRQFTGPVALGVKLLHPRRLATPPKAAGKADVALGVERDEDGRPIAYHVDQPRHFGAWETWTNTVRIPAAAILHYFTVHEADQVRGVPWLAPCLQQLADLRDYDAQVLDAARQAADLAVFWYTDSPDVEAWTGSSDATEIERRTQTQGPPGWKPQQLTPQQPSTQYLDYRAERLRELGRPVNMPLMTVRLDSAKHSYSSARFDGQAYAVGLRTLQAWLSAGPLRRLADGVATELRAGGKLPTPPARVRYVWTWPVRPHVDPAKEANAERIRLQNGTLTYTDALAAHGLQLETTIATRKKERQALDEAGLPMPPELPAKPGQAAPAKPAAKPASAKDRAFHVATLANGQAL